MDDDTLDLVRAWISTYNADALLADGFEDALLGIAERCSHVPLVVYDADQCIKILMKRDGMTYEEAAECFSFNTLAAWMGEHTPMFLWRRPEIKKLRTDSPASPSP